MDKEVRKYLIDLARIRRTVAYGTAMQQFGYNVANQPEIDYFADIIGDISIYEHQWHRPMLSSLVIHATGNSIGKGFYRLAEQLGYGDKEKLFRQHFEKEMQERCYTYWRNSDNYANELSGNEDSDLNIPLIKDELLPEGITSIPMRKFTFMGYDTDWDQKYTDDKVCGALGEELVINYEQNILERNGHSDWAQDVKKVKDGSGYDIISKDAFGNPKFIEVKTTLFGRQASFSISINEIAFSEQHANNYYLYRLYNLNISDKTAKFNEYKGSIKDHFFVEATQFDTFNKKRA